MYRHVGIVQDLEHLLGRKFKTWGKREKEMELKKEREKTEMLMFPRARNHRIIQVGGDLERSLAQLPA